MLIRTLAFLLLLSLTVEQNAAQENPNNSLRMRAPDFKSMVTRLQLLSNDSVQVELGIYPLQLAAELPGRSTNREALEKVFESLSPGQRARLEQAVFQAEISYLGYYDAFAVGALGEEIHFEVADYPEFKEECRQILEEEHATVKTIRMNTQDRILRQLPPDMRQLGQILLGEPFVFQDAQLLRGKGRNSNTAAVGNERSITDAPNYLLTLLYNRSVRDELRLTIPQYQAVCTVHQQRFNELKKAILDPRLRRERNFGDSQKIYEKDSISEILLPAQMKRLLQLQYHVEIAEKGFASAISQGRLAFELGVTDNQVSSLARGTERIEADSANLILKQHQLTQEKVLGCLSTKHRQAAGKLIGPYFEFESPELIEARAVFKDEQDFALHGKNGDSEVSGEPRDKPALSKE